MNFLKSLWRKLFRVKTGGYGGDIVFHNPMIEVDWTDENQWLFKNGLGKTNVVSREEIVKMCPKKDMSSGSLYGQLHIAKRLFKAGYSPREIKNYPLLPTRPAYDPREDENKIMSGEVESYFD